MEKRVTISLRLPEEMLAAVRQIAAQEERPLNTQVLRFIRAGMENYRPGQPPTYTLKRIFNEWCVWKNATQRDLAAHLRVSLETLTQMESFPLEPDWRGGWGETESTDPVLTWSDAKIRALSVLFGADYDRLAEVLAGQRATADDE
jgi:hypothetical protein